MKGKVFSPSPTSARLPLSASPSASHHLQLHPHLHLQLHIHPQHLLKVFDLEFDHQIHYFLQIYLIQFHPLIKNLISFIQSDYYFPPKFFKYTVNQFTQLIFLFFNLLIIIVSSWYLSYTKLYSLLRKISVKFFCFLSYLNVYLYFLIIQNRNLRFDLILLHFWVDTLSHSLSK